MHNKRIKHTNTEMLQAVKLMVKHGYTVRKTAELTGLSKSTLFLWIKKELLSINSFLYHEVDTVLKKNFAERHFRGGMSTKRKYEVRKLQETAYPGWKIYG